MEDTIIQNKTGGNRSDKLLGKYLLTIDTYGEIREISLEQLRKTRLYLGRTLKRDSSGAANDIILPSQVVSASHGKFKISGSQILYADLGSTNGTIYESDGYRKLLKKSRNYTVLRSGDMLRIQPKEGNVGNSVLILYTDINEKGTWRQFPLLAAKTKIGRDMENDIVLSHPAISRFHMAIVKESDSYRLLDLNSSNGVFVNGIRLRGSRILKEKDVIRIANNTLIFTNNRVFYKNTAQGINIEARHINKYVGRQKKQILTDVSCTIESNAFVAIIGGSGAGKTTLMNAISGFDRKVSGQILFNGISVRDNFAELKDLIGYVPQEDIIYDNLTLQRMLWYTAKLKMPGDITAQEIDKRIQNVLSMVELTEHRNTFIRKLSGGQKKRASIAVEMLADPSVFFLDEPTSGLDPGTEQKLMITLNKLSKSQGKTVVMVTHTTQSLQLCDQVIFMGRGGQLCFQGTTEQARQFFETDDLVDIYNKISDNPDFWSDQFARASSASEGRRLHEKREDALPEPGSEKRKKADISQFFTLTGRYSELIRNDLQRLLMLFLQPVAIALLLALVANDKIFFIAEDTKNILFCLTCAGIWIGLFNSIQEICKERIILKREYMGNLRLPFYVLSKFTVQTLIGFMQAMLLTFVFIAFVGSPLEGVLFTSPLPELLITVWLTIESATGLGFLISSFVRNTDRAMTIAPFALIIQLLFSGILFELKGAGRYIAYATTSKWSMEAMGSTAVLNDLPLRLQKKFAAIGRSSEAIFLSNPSHIFTDWLILAAMTLLCGAICSFLLRSVSHDGR